MTDHAPTRSASAAPLRWACWIAGAVAALQAAILARAGLEGLWMAPNAPGVGLVDFAAFWAGAKLALAGHAAQVYDWGAIQAVLQQAFGGEVASRLPIYYPPPFLLLTAPLGVAPYATAFAAWCAAGLLAYLAVVRAACPGLAGIAVALAAPGVWACLMVGQNGLATAALLGGGLVLLERRPGLAGVLLGLLCVKPQLALLVPVALIAGGRWRAVASAAVTAAALTGASLVLLGAHTFTAFLSAGHEAQTSFGATGWLAWSKVQTVYGALRRGGVEPVWAWLGHGLVALSAAVCIARLWRGAAPFALKAAALTAGGLLATPYAFLYDAPVLGLSAVFLLSAARGRWTGWAMAATAALGSAAFAAPAPVVAPVAALLLALAAWEAARAQARSSVESVNIQLAAAA